MRTLSTLLVAGLFILTLPSCSLMTKRLGWNTSTPYPSMLADKIQQDKDLAELINHAFEGFDNGEYVDHHVHLVGLARHHDNFKDSPGEPSTLNPKKTGKGFCGNGHLNTETALNRYWLYLNNRRFKPNHLLNWGQTKVFMQASGIRSKIDNNESQSKANMEYAEQLYQAVRHFRIDQGQTIKDPGTFILLPLDAYHLEDGSIDWDATDIFIPNDYALLLRDCLNSRFESETGKDFRPFETAVSIHPYRHDSIDLLEIYSQKGIRFVKWLPNTMNINPRHPKSVAFYKKMKDLGMVLITHSGHEEATIAKDENQHFGNPSLFDLAGNEGLTMVIAHSGYQGVNWSEDGPTPNTLAFQAMHSKYATVYGGLSATLFIKSKLFNDYSNTDDDSNDDIANTPLPCFQPHADDPEEHVYMTDHHCYLLKNLEKIFNLAQRDQAKARFVNGSDYPLPAVNLLKPTNTLYRYGYITRKEKSLLDKIYRYNPLLFDFVMKRTAKNPNTGKHLPKSVFKGIP